MIASIVGFVAGFVIVGYAMYLAMRNGI